MSRNTLMRPLLEWPASFPTWPVGFWPPKMELLGPSTDIRIEEFDSDHHRVIRAEIPGIDPEKDVSLTVDDDVLSIDITRERRAEKTCAPVRSFCRCCSFVSASKDARMFSATSFGAVAWMRSNIAAVRFSGGVS